MLWRKVATFDIEATGLNTTYGHLLCAGFKFQHEDEPRMIVAEKYKDEKAALKLLSKTWDEASEIYHWNGFDFDVRFVNARLAFYGLKPLAQKNQCDLLLIHRHRYRTTSHRLDHVAVSLRCKSRKYEVAPDFWQIVQSESHPQYEEAVEKIVRHCKFDVILTEEVASKMAPFIRTLQWR